MNKFLGLILCNKFNGNRIKIGVKIFEMHKLRQINPKKYEKNHPFFEDEKVEIFQKGEKNHPFCRDFFVRK